MGRGSTARRQIREEVVMVDERRPFLLAARWLIHAC
jgi:hypothetical protein